MKSGLSFFVLLLTIAMTYQASAFAKDGIGGWRHSKIMKIVHSHGGICFGSCSEPPVYLDADEVYPISLDDPELPHEKFGKEYFDRYYKERDTAVNKLFPIVESILACVDGSNRVGSTGDGVAHCKGKFAKRLYSQLKEAVLINRAAEFQIGHILRPFGGVQTVGAENEVRQIIAETKFLNPVSIYKVTCTEDICDVATWKK